MIRGDNEWRRVVPPLVSWSDVEGAALSSALGPLTEKFCIASVGIGCLFETILLDFVPHQGAEFDDGIGGGQGAYSAFSKMRTRFRPSENGRLTMWFGLEMTTIAS